MPARKVKRLKGSEGRSRCLSVEEIGRLLAGRTPPLTRAVPIPLHNFTRRVLTVQAAYAKNGEHRDTPDEYRLDASPPTPYNRRSFRHPNLREPEGRIVALLANGVGNRLQEDGD